MAAAKDGKKKEDEGEDDDPFKDWTPDQPIPDEEGESAAQRAAILERRKQHLLEEAKKKKSKNRRKKPNTYRTSIWENMYRWRPRSQLSRSPLPSRR